MNKDVNTKSNLRWFYATLSLPYIIMFTTSFLMSLVWSNIWEIPTIGGMIHIEFIPIWIAIGALLYCFSKIQFSKLQSKLLVISALVVYIIVTTPFIALIIGCGIWNDCP